MRPNYTCSSFVLSWLELPVGGRREKIEGRRRRKRGKKGQRAKVGESAEPTTREVWREEGRIGEQWTKKGGES